jgi:putative membrane protein
VTTLVVCVDRDNDIGRKAGVTPPITGWEAVRSLVIDVGLAEPEATGVNSLLESLRVTRELRDEGEDAVVAVLSGSSENAITADRAIAVQVDALIERYEPTQSIVVIDSVDDERVVPIIESRLQVDAVDRVIVRQTRDIESTYYLLKQFLADEELRTTVLVPLGIGLLLIPILLFWFSPAVALGGVAALLGLGVLYKGLGVDEQIGSISEWSRELLYSGRVAVVTYVAALGLTVVGLFVGALGVSETGGTDPGLFAVAAFVHHSIPWLALAAVTAGTGRLLDELLVAETVQTPYLNLPFGLLSVGIVVRGFTGYVFESQLVVGSAVLTPAQRLVCYIIAGVVVSLIGVRVTTLLEQWTMRGAVDQQN